MKILNWVTIICLPLLLLSCIGSKSLQTCKTLGAGKKEIGWGMSSFRSKTQPNDEYEPVQAGSVHFMFRNGISEKIDFYTNIGIHAAGAGIKFQAIGNQSSKFAASAGMEFELGFLHAGVNIPFNFSFHPSKKLALYYCFQPSFYSNHSFSILDASQTPKLFGHVKGIHLKVGKTNVYFEHSLTSFKNLNDLKTSQLNFSVGYSI